MILFHYWGAAPPAVMRHVLFLEHFNELLPPHSKDVELPDGKVGTPELYNDHLSEILGRPVRVVARVPPIPYATDVEANAAAYGEILERLKIVVWFAHADLLAPFEERRALARKKTFRNSSLM